MNFIARLKLIYFILILAGCSHSFLPPPYENEMWERSKTTLLEVNEIMIQCGYPSSAGANRGTNPNEIALMHLCMERKGFKYKGRFGSYCSMHPSLPACVEARAEKLEAKSK
ncbi:MAG: hypothetical protein U1E78_05060 [Gammaproteobacteria bacterium]